MERRRRQHAGPVRSAAAASAAYDRVPDVASMPSRRRRRSARCRPRSQTVAARSWAVSPSDSGRIGDD